MLPEAASRCPIGVFDSGVGGLTVYHALKTALPYENFLYLGDTARVPYGIKTPDTIIHYALQAARLLVDEGIKFLVVACNTATGPALPILQKTYTEIPVMGVIEPGAAAALAVSKTKRIGVIATSATIAAHSYQEALKHLDHEAHIIEKAASLLVPLAEEGLIEGEIPLSIVRHYLDELLNQRADAGLDTLILGCTHFPILAKVIRQVVGDTMQIVDSAESVSRAVHAYFEAHPALQNLQKTKGLSQFWVTDGVGRFMSVAKLFLGEELLAEQVKLVDLI